MDKPWAYIKGLTSRCQDKEHHVLFLDYDHIEWNIVEEELLRIQNKHKLPPFITLINREYIEESTKALIGNYGIICPIKLSFSECQTIQAETHIDSLYKGMPSRTRFKAWVIRLTTKGNRPAPTCKGWIGYKINLDKPVSTAHLQGLYTLFFNLEQLNFTNQDQSTHSWITKYMTESNTELIETEIN